MADRPDLESHLKSLDLNDNERNKVLSFAQNGYLIIDPEFDRFEEVSSRIIRQLAPLYQSGLA